MSSHSVPPQPPGFLLDAVCAMLDGDPDRAVEVPACVLVAAFTPVFVVEDGHCDLVARVTAYLPEGEAMPL